MNACGSFERAAPVFLPASEARRCGGALFIPRTKAFRNEIRRAKPALRAIARGFCGRLSVKPLVYSQSSVFGRLARITHTLSFRARGFSQLNNEWASKTVSYANLPLEPENVPWGVCLSSFPKNHLILVVSAVGSETKPITCHFFAAL